ncbi:hypothetical protein XELAEV_18011139mg [Xenopus laevis]|uniref:Uncharacterized protein n=1 Tax=Xenopus laevis TaxID=8355 RepID=A0A974DY25_XENLA|nr:hypothetical protein XELAEV_18011139mg [Xenopus laevis]
MILIVTMITVLWISNHRNTFHNFLFSVYLNVRRVPLANTIMKQRWSQVNVRVAGAAQSLSDCTGAIRSFPDCCICSHS